MDHGVAEHGKEAGGPEPVGRPVRLALDVPRGGHQRGDHLDDVAVLEQPAAVQVEQALEDVRLARRVHDRQPELPLDPADARRRGQALVEEPQQLRVQLVDGAPFGLERRARGARLVGSA